MSSATSIEREMPLGGGEPPQPVPEPARSASASEKSTMRPWHFFVLLSMIAASAAVLLAGRARPEHLILLSFTVAAAGAAAVAFHRMLAPLVADDVPVIGERLTERSRAALEREKRLTLRSIKELEFDRAMGKLSARDFDEMAGRLRARAIMLMRQLDEGGGRHRDLIERELQARLANRQTPMPAALVCGDCGTANDPDARFCKACGSRLAGAPGPGSRQVTQ